MIKYLLFFIFCLPVLNVEATTINYNITESTTVLYYPSPTDPSFYRLHQAWNGLGTATYNTDTGDLNWSTSMNPKRKLLPNDDAFYGDSLVESSHITVPWSFNTSTDGSFDTIGCNDLATDFTSDGQLLPLSQSIYLFHLVIPVDLSFINLTAGYSGTKNGLNIDVYETNTEICFKEVTTPEPATLFLSLISILLGFDLLKRKNETAT